MLRSQETFVHSLTLAATLAGFCGRVRQDFRMGLASNVAVGLVALLHVYFFVLESFLWTTPYGRRVFGLSPEKAEMTKSLAANQGLYNGFLAAGLVWSLMAGDDAHTIKIFFLSCVVIAGIVGAMTANRKILWVQAVPGAIAMACLCAAAK